MAVRGGSGCGARGDAIVLGKAAKAVGFYGRVFAGSVEAAAGTCFVEAPRGQGGPRVAVRAGDALGSFEGADDELVGVGSFARSARSSRSLIVVSVDDGAALGVEAHVQGVVVEGGGQVAGDRAGDDDLLGL